MVYYIVYFIELEYRRRLALFMREMCRKLNFEGKKVFRIWKKEKATRRISDLDEFFIMMSREN